MFILILGLLKSPEWGLFNNHSPYQLPWLFNTFSPALWLLLVGCLTFAAFIQYEIYFERRHGSSLIPTSWFSNKQFLNGTLILITMYVIFGGINFTLVAFLQVAINLSAVETGTIILIFAVSLIVFSIITPSLFKAYDNKFIAMGAFAICALGAVITWLSTSATEVGLGIFFAMFVFGAGLGMLSSQSVVIITKSVPSHEAPRTSGVQATLRNVGLAIGIAVIAGMGQSAMENIIRGNIEGNSEYSPKIQHAIQNSKTIPYITDEQLSSYLAQYAIAVPEKSKLLALNTEARHQNFHFSVLLIGLFSIIGMLACTRLEKKTTPPDYNKSIR